MRQFYFVILESTLLFSILLYIFKIFQQYTAVPETPLLTSKVLKEETEQWPEVQQEMSLGNIDSRKF